MCVYYVQEPVSSPQQYGKEKIYTTCGQEKWSASLDIMKIQTRLGRWLNEEELLFCKDENEFKSPAQHRKSGMAALACDANTEETETDRSQDLGDPGPGISLVKIVSF